MNRIRIEYQGKMRLYVAPDNWDGMTRKQLFAWCGILRQRLDEDRAMDSAVMLFYGIPVGLFVQLNAGQRFQLRETLGWLTDENRLVENVIGSLQLLGRRYHGPAGRLANVTIDEYRRTELYYQLWLRTGKRDLVRLLAATLFRPAGKGTDDDVREPVSERRIVRRAQLFKLMHPNWLHAVLLLYEGCRGGIIRKHPRVFVKGKGTGDGPPQLVDIGDHILAYSGEKLGSYKDTKETNVWVFFKHCTQRLEEYEKLKNEMR